MVRPALADDALGAARVHVRAWQRAYRGMIPQNHLDSLSPEDWARRYKFGRIGIGVPATLVAVDDATICGLVTVGLCRDEDVANCGELFAFYVDPIHQGSGIGRLLMTAARARLRSIVTAAALWVLDENLRARQFYERDGWVLDGNRRTATYGNAALELVRYRCAPI